MTYNTKILVDAVVGWSLINKRIDKAYNLLENMALNHYQCSNEKGGSQKKILWKYDVDALDIIAAKVEALS